MLFCRGLNKQGYQCRREYSLVWGALQSEHGGLSCLFPTLCSPPTTLTPLSCSPSLAECNAAIHKKCIDKVIAKCTGSAVNSRETMVSMHRRTHGQRLMDRDGWRRTLMTPELGMEGFVSWVDCSAQGSKQPPPLLTSYPRPSVPQGAFQDRHASPLQGLHLPQPYLLRALWDAAVGAGAAGPQV